MSRAIELPPIEDEEAARPRWSERLAALAGMGTGWRTIAAKELSDNILNVRFYVLLAIVGLAAIGTVYFSSQGLKDAAQSVGEQARQYTGHAPLFLLLFTVTGNPLPFPFFSLISFVLPLIGIAFGFDAINGERAEGTLPRLLAQPIHRDDVVNGKFAAGLAVIALILASVTAFVAGFGIFRLGIVPSSDEVARIVAWVIVSIVFVAFWLAFAMLCSVAIRRSSTAALVAVGVWLVFSLFFNLIAGLVAGVFAGGRRIRSTLTVRIRTTWDQREAIGMPGRCLTSRSRSRPARLRLTTLPRRNSIRTESSWPAKRAGLCSGVPPTGFEPVLRP